MIQIYDEPYRPKIHFTPQSGWMNDPNGMVYFDGEYHLFYQFTPNRIDVPGPKHWGHAVSQDLVHWSHLPVALSPDQLGEIFSGSIVVDWENRSGFQTGDSDVLVAVFTHHDHGLQQQSLAYSNDKGRTWLKYSGNPVIPNPGFKDFRDPKIVWHQESDQWVMALAVGDKVMFYTSPNLIDWTLVSTFGELEGAHSGVWECPDLFPIPIDGSLEESFWVLLISVGSGAPSGGSGTQYFIGTFDGKVFVNREPASKTNWVDYGRDNYAGVTFSGLNERRIVIGWMSNWHYAYQVPTKPWKGTMTLPREFSLVERYDGSLGLLSRPIPELQNLRREHVSLTNRRFFPGDVVPVLKGLNGVPFEVEVDISLSTAGKINIELLSHGGDSVILGYDMEAEKLYIDRRGSGWIDFEPGFGQHIHSAHLPLDNSNLHLQIFVDSSSIEVFANEGIIVLTDLFFPYNQLDEMVIYTSIGEATIMNLDTWILSDIWR